MRFGDRSRGGHACQSAALPSSRPSGSRFHVLAIRRGQGRPPGMEWPDPSRDGASERLSCLVTAPFRKTDLNDLFIETIHHQHIVR